MGLVTEQTFASSLEAIDRARRVRLDCETTGLGTWTGDKVVGVAAQPEGGDGNYFPLRHGSGPNLPPECKRQLVQALSGKELEGFHLRFDIENMHNEGLPLPPRIIDAGLAARLMNENEPCFALKVNKAGEPGLAPKYLGPDSIKAERALHALLVSRGLAKEEMWKLSGAEVAEYACDDLVLPGRLLNEVYFPALEKWGMLETFAEYNDYQRCLIDMEIGGLPIDQTVVHRALAEGETARESLLAEIHQAAGYALNPNSPKQVCAWLGLENAQEETVMASKHPQAELLIDYKAYVKRDGTYLEKFIEYADAKGVLHVLLNLMQSEFESGGTKNGRLSCARPNLQAMPKPGTNSIYSACRQAVAAPSGYTIVEADYSQAEVRVGGHYSREPAIVRAFAEGRDMYQEWADLLGITRQESKILFLALQYGAGDWKVAEMLGISKAEATRLRKGWHKNLPRVAEVMRRMSRKAERNGAIKLFTGRWRHFDGARKGPHCKSPYYAAWNSLVQGSVAEMVRLAMMRLWPVCLHYGARMLLQVHDSVLFLVPTSCLHEFVAAAKVCMEDFPIWSIPARVDVKAGPNWLDVKKLEAA